MVLVVMSRATESSSEILSYSVLLILCMLLLLLLRLSLNLSTQIAMHLLVSAVTLGLVLFHTSVVLFFCCLPSFFIAALHFAHCQGD